jgi:GDSL-like lipase/acylhydrolase family protein
MKITIRHRKLPLLVYLYVLELALLVVLVAMHKKGEKPILAFLNGSSGLVFIIGVAVLVICFAAVVHECRNDRPEYGKSATAVFALNIWSVFLMFAVCEAAIRMFAVSTPPGPVFANTLLLPRKWDETAARYRAILATASALGSYLIYDRELGWTIGSNRRSRDYNRKFARDLLTQRLQQYPDMYPPESLAPGREDDEIYFSSIEGIRSPRAGMAFADTQPKRRIAIIGDSFTFGLEVRYEDTWGHKLERRLGSDFQVLNFGVDGYGIDQMYLRYKRDVPAWHPDIVILAFINDDFRRTMCAYGFLCFPGGEIPFAKPRFVIEGKTLKALNVPLPEPEWIFTRESIDQIPFVEYDGSFESNDWDWGFYDRSYAVRFLLSRLPRWPTARPVVSDMMLRTINGELLRSFVKLAEDRHSTPIVVYFPNMLDFVDESRGRLKVAREVLRAEGIPYYDMSECISKVNPSERFVVLHYSARTNAAISDCLARVINGLKTARE